MRTTIVPVIAVLVLVTGDYGMGAAPATAPAARPAAVSARPATRPAAAPAADRQLSMEEIRALFDSEQYADALRGIARVLPLKGKAAEPYDRYDLLMLKAEALLRTKATAGAIAAFTQAGDETKDAQKAAVAKATVLLLKGSKNLAYTPKKGDKSVAIDVIDADGRKKALQALLADEMAAAAPKINAALDARTLPPIAEALKLLPTLDLLEQATGGEGDSKRLLQDMREKGNELMTKAVDRMGRNVEAISKSANEMIEYRRRYLIGNVQQEELRLRKRGLTRQDMDDLKAVIDTCAQIAPHAEDLAQATGGRPRDVEPLLDAADTLRRRADKVLKAEYGEN